MGREIESRLGVGWELKKIFFRVLAKAAWSSGIVSACGATMGREIESRLGLCIYVGSSFLEEKNVSGCGAMGCEIESRHGMG
jgi:hypothetical protein